MTDADGFEDYTYILVYVDYLLLIMKDTKEAMELQYTMYLSTARGSSLAVNDHTMDVRVTSDRPRSSLRQTFN